MSLSRNLLGIAVASALASAFPSMCSATPQAAIAVPAIFAPGVISGPANDGSPSFMPDGKTLFFTRSGTGAGTIMQSHLGSAGWSAPTIAPFSGVWNDQHAAVSPDGQFLVFVSTRPVPGSTERVAHVWRVDRTAAGWSEPTHLSPAVNRGARIFAPSVAADGTIYFLSIGPDKSFQLYRSRYVDGAYQTAEALSFSSPATADVDPMIAPDQSFLVFSSSARRTTGDKQEHLYIVFNKQNVWGTPIPIRYAGDESGASNDNEPSLSPDLRTLYFSSDRTLPISLPRTRAQAAADLARIQAWDNGNINVWTLTLAPWLKGNV